MLIKPTEQSSNPSEKGAPGLPSHPFPSCAPASGTSPSGTGDSWTEGSSWGNKILIVLSDCLIISHSIPNWEPMDLPSCCPKLETVRFKAGHWTLILPPAFLVQFLAAQWYPEFVVRLAAEKLPTEMTEGIFLRPLQFWHVLTFSWVTLLCPLTQLFLCVYVCVCIN